MRRPHLHLVMATLTLALATLPGASARAAVPVLVVDGRGWGHGVGMAQDGALRMGREGASAAEILGHFYPGVHLGRAGGRVRVVVHTAEAGAALVALPPGGEVRSPASGRQHPGFPVTVPPGGMVRVRWDGARYHVEPGGGGAEASAAQISTGSSTTTLLPPVTTTTTPLPEPPSSTTTTSAPRPGGQPPSTAAPPGGPSPPSHPSSPAPLWIVPADFGTVAVPSRGARYRGVVEATAQGPRGEPAPLRLVNELDVEDYLRGMGEVRDPGWPAAGLQAQAIAARTYALRAMAASGELCDTQRCQVYLGSQAEYAAMDRAVADTRGVVIVHGRTLASAVYSANAGGVSATPEEGFGTPGAPYPYLRSAPYPTGDPAPWRVDVALADLAARFGYPGTLHDVTVRTTGPSGRAIEVALAGDAGTSVVPGIDFARRLGLRSTLMTLRTEVADAPPPPPEPAEDATTLQALPEEAAAPGSAFGRPASSPTAPAGRDVKAPDERGAPGWTFAAVLAAVALAGAYGTWALWRTERRR